jgi:hypothetical protein
MNRRGFLGSILAAGAAPSIVSAGSLMQIWTPANFLAFDGVKDDTEALLAWADGRRTFGPDGRLVGLHIQGKDIYLPEAVFVPVPEWQTAKYIVSDCTLYIRQRKGHRVDWQQERWATRRSNFESFSNNIGRALT